MEEQRCAEPLSESERLATHNTIMAQLASEGSCHKTGTNGSWRAGANESRIQRIFETKDCMIEQHITAFAERLKKSIIVLDGRKTILCITEYRPGFATPRCISARSALQLRESGEALWIAMDPGHFSALMPVNASESRSRV